jgi:hypothetical protein
MGLRKATIAFLAKDATIRFPPGPSATVVRVESGTVLVTREGDPEDHVLESSDEIVLPRGGLAIAWALTDATVFARALGREASVVAAASG